MLATVMLIYSSRHRTQYSHTFISAPHDDLQEIDELIRADKVASLISQAESALKSEDYANCLKLCDSALRMDAGNSDVQRIIKVAQPKFDQPVV